MSRIARDLGTVGGAGQVEEWSRDEAGLDGLCHHLYSLTGIALPPSAKNRSLVVSRLSSVLRKHRFTNLRAYLKELKGRRPDDELNTEFISALTTNTTQFFREPAHFEALQREFRTMLEQKSEVPTDNREIRVWCAAASSGQEPLSMMILMHHELKRQASMGRVWNLKFLASDIDEAILEKATQGEYAAHETQGLSDEVKERYFMQAMGEGRIRAHPELLNRIQFAKINLVSMPYPFQRQFDIVFVRNVLIYFDQETVARVIDQMARVLRPGGLLFLGHSESGCMRHPLFESISHSVYRRLARSR